MQALSPFDILAETYDSDFVLSHIGQMQRKRVWKFLLPYIQSESSSLKILEINCGTGEDALRLAEIGHDVTATDASGVMIEKAKQKLFSSTVPNRNMRFIQCSFSELRNYFENERFDLVFSNFGGLNCIDEHEIVQLCKNLSILTTSNGHLFFVAMGRYCLWEISYYFLRGKLGTAFRRLKKSLPFKVNNYTMPVYYYQPSQLVKLFSSSFRHIHNWPVGLFIPPSYLEKQFLHRDHWLTRLNHWEEKWAKFSILSSLSDHYCIVFKKNC